ncbi:SGNH/GDSL hydrolase family protein [Roseinatronobacter alkalisoli]|uniref:SGNH/GDSL hydrolase family protein n=1 Tax=Roseinatronobacter alkalisoli TaxID=3028235 RepID=A0ABT5T7E8_9RHOB|nr:SGNH/GDSL hydrolase family protein [Roseinatronobacter sp. HJB301]MDD7970974.1 SGNH/GDSL hydrolase family protein [Roseinatronobacter sp. HJB301]
MPVVVCFGDSNTYGSVPNAGTGPWTRYDRQIRWPGRMAAVLGPDWHVIEEGLPGRTTCHDNPFDGAHKNGARLLPAILESHAPIDVFVLMLGTNDLKVLHAVSATDIEHGLRVLGQRVLASNAGPDQRAPRLLLVAPAPVAELGAAAERLAGGAAKSHRLGSMIAALAQELGAGFVDAGAHVQVSDIDGVHLSATAHITLGQVMAQAVRQMD